MYITILVAQLWSLPSASYHTVEIFSTMPSTFRSSLKISSILQWNISPLMTVPNGSLVYLYLLNWHLNVIKYDDFLSKFGSWYPEPAFTSDRLYTFVSFRNMSLAVRALCTGFINAKWSLAWSKDRQTVPFGFCNNRRQLHLSVESLNP